MSEAIIRHLKKLRHNRRGISNVLVVMLSLVLVVVIVANVILWSYQMSQLDIERMQESLSITNATRITHSAWFAAQNEFSIITGSRIGGSYLDTKNVDDFQETFREEFPSTHYNPSDYILGSSTKLVSGTITDVQTDNDVYMQFESYPSAFSSTTEIFGNNVAGTSYRGTVNTIVGSVFTPTKDGEAQSITIYVRVTYSSKNMRCAIYLHSNLSLIAQTEERTVQTGTAWVTFNFNTLRPVLRAGTEYLLVAWARSSSGGNANLYYTSGAQYQGHYVSSTYGSSFPNPMPNPTHESRAYCIYCTFKPAVEEKIEIEFTGTADTQSWTNLTWSVNNCFTTDEVTTTYQLYNYQTGEYPASGDGYKDAIIGTAEDNITQSITSNPMNFKDAEGNWKMKITGTKATSAPFNFKVDFIELEAVLSNVYQLEICNLFAVDLSRYPLSYMYGIEIMVRYNVSEEAKRWFIEAYDWASASFNDAGFNNTGGSQPIPNEWNEYTVSVAENWMSYIDSEGVIQIKFSSEKTSENQTLVNIDFIGVRAILNGACLDIKNGGALTTHIVSIWVINSTYHKRYDADFFINSGESAEYIRLDIDLTSEDFKVKVVTERGNIAVFSSS
ncbi:hypothetical protein KEJ45_02120 [Candidatus Bathyarchaeota archaeon]|nr:hypothetical protein [Candidatus Bathyarchaeota archaeon]